MWCIALCSVSLKFSDVFVFSQSQFLYPVPGNQATTDCFIYWSLYTWYIYLSNVYECVYILYKNVYMLYIHILFFLEILFKWNNVIHSYFSLSFSVNEVFEIYPFVRVVGCIYGLFLLLLSSIPLYWCTLFCFSIYQLMTI